VAQATTAAFASTSDCVHKAPSTSNGAGDVQPGPSACRRGGRIDEKPSWFRNICRPNASILPDKVERDLLAMVPIHDGVVARALQFAHSPPSPPPPRRRHERMSCPQTAFARWSVLDSPSRLERRVQHLGRAEAVQDIAPCSARARVAMSGGQGLAGRHAKTGDFT